jgi:hypothetical protein
MFPSEAMNILPGKALSILRIPLRLSKLIIVGAGVQKVSVMIVNLGV